MAAPNAGGMLAALRLIYRMLLAAQVAFLVVALGLLYMRGGPLATMRPDLAYVLQFLVPGLNIILIGLTYLVYTRRMTKARRLRSLALKLNSYQISVVIRAAMLQGAGLFDVVVFLQTGQFYYLLFFAGMLALYLSKRPGIANATQELGLDTREVDVLSGTN